MSYDHPSEFTITKEPIRRVYANRNPTPSDTLNLHVGDEWLNRPGKIWWKMVDFSNSSGAFWMPMNSSSHADFKINNLAPSLRNITIEGSSPINITNDEKTSTVSIGFEGNVADKFYGNSGKTSPVMGSVNIIGTDNIETKAATGSICIGLKPNVASTFLADTGDCTAIGYQVKVVGSKGIKTLAHGNSISISADSNIPFKFKTDSGTASTSDNLIHLIAGSGIETSANGNTIKISALTPQMPSFQTNRSPCTSMSNSFTFTGFDGSGVSTVGTEGAMTFLLRSPFVLEDFVFANNAPNEARKVSIENRAEDDFADSILQLKVKSKKGGCPFVQYSVEKEREYRQGILNDEKRSFALYTNPDDWSGDGKILRKITYEGVQTLPQQPAFFASVLDDQNSVTGDSTLAAVVFDNVHFDRGGHFLKYAYEIPSPGVWSFQSCLKLLNIWPAHQRGAIFLNVGNNYYLGSEDNPRTRISEPGASVTYNGSWMLSLKEGDLVRVVIQVSMGTKVVSLKGSPGGNFYPSHFSGALLS